MEERTRSTSEMLARLKGAVRNIEDSASAFDRGNAGIAGAIASEIYRIFVPLIRDLRLLGHWNFYSTPNSYRETNLLPECHLIGMDVHVTTDDGGNANIDLTYAAVGDVYGFKISKYSKWRSEVLLRDGAAPDHRVGIPTDKARQIPRADRLAVNRGNFLKIISNKIGSHYDKRIPAEVELAERALFFGFGFSIKTATGEEIELEADPSRYLEKNRAFEAAARQIATEILFSWGDAHNQSLLRRI